MEELVKENKSLMAHIQQVEQERDELRKDIEQLCMQQAGPSYLAVATRMHFQRTAALEQEIENLKSKLAACNREKSNLQEELSEAYHIKGQLANLHAAEVSKNMEAEKQLKFFQSCVASAFAERDQSIMEAEKAKEKEEFMAEKFNPLERRVEELARDSIELKKLRDTLRNDLEEQSKQNEIFRKVVDRFYEFRQYSLYGFCEDRNLVDKCEILLHDSPEKWVFGDQEETSSSKYVSAMEAEVEALRKSVDDLQSKLCVGLKIESHLKKRVHDLEKKQSLSEEAIKMSILQLLYSHSQLKEHIRNCLAEEYSYIKSIVDVIGEKIRQLDENREQSWKSPPRDMIAPRNLHENSVTELIDKKIPDVSNSVAPSRGDASEALAQALQEKVSALLLLSQQEERHLLEKHENVALQKKIEELQRNLLQVTNEKVKALMEFAELKQQYQRLQEVIDQEMNQGKVPSEIGGRKIVQETDRRFKNLLKKTYLNRWMAPSESPLDETESHLNNTGNVVDRRSSYNIDIARMKIENATLKESLESMEHLTSAVRRLRRSISQVEESVSSGVSSGTLEAVKDIVYEADLLKTALSSSLPVSWSSEASYIASSFGNNNQAGEKATTRTMISSSGGDADIVSSSSSEKMDFVSAAGFEMVEIVILAAQILNDYIISKQVESESSKSPSMKQ